MIPQTLAKVKVPQVHKLWQQMWRPEQQAGSVNMAWEDCETQDKQQAFLDDSSMWNEKRASIQLPMHGCQPQKMLHHTASRSAAWWTRSLTLLPQGTIPEGHGWGILARVTEGACQYSCLFKIHPLINRTQPQGVVMPALSPALTEQLKSKAQESILTFQDPKLYGKESMKKRIKVGPACMRGPN